MSNTNRFEASPLATRDSKRADIAESAKIYILEHLDIRISVQYLASRLGVSERTLRYAFHDAYHMSPSQFLKTTRLQRARRALHDANPKRTTVLREALRSGFWHMSRFSAEYKQRFGELPSTTLKSRPISRQLEAR